LHAIIPAFTHKQKHIQKADYDKLFKPGDNSTKVMADIKGLLNRTEYEAAGYNYWRF